MTACLLSFPAVTQRDGHANIWGHMHCTLHKNINIILHTLILHTHAYTHSQAHAHECIKCHKHKFSVLIKLTIVFPDQLTPLREFCEADFTLLWGQKTLRTKIRGLIITQRPAATKDKYTAVWMVSWQVLLIKMAPTAPSPSHSPTHPSCCPSPLSLDAQRTSYQGTSGTVRTLQVHCSLSQASPVRALIPHGYMKSTIHYYLKLTTFLGPQSICKSGS